MHLEHSDEFAVVKNLGVSNTCIIFAGSALVPNLPLSACSDKLDSEAIVEFVQALCAIAQEQLDPAHAPRVYGLTKIVEIAHFNMSRIRFSLQPTFEPLHLQKPDFSAASQMCLCFDIAVLTCLAIYATGASLI